MRDAVQVKILNALLDKYERSTFFKTNTPPTRRIMLYFYNGGVSDFPYYDIEQSERRMTVNQAVIALADESLLAFDWMKGERGHIVAAVWLNVANLTAAYQAAGREPKRTMVDKVRKAVDALQATVKTPWIRQYLHDMQETMTRKQHIPSGIPADDGQRALLFTALQAIDQLGDSECTERLFSLQTFGDSKIFEREVKPRLLRILRQYLDKDDDADDEAVFMQLGIVKYPEQFECSGPLSIEFPDGRLDFGCLPTGGVVYSSDLAFGVLSVSAAVETVITIENRANYIEYIKKARTEKALIIYHGGQYSPRKGQFLRRVALAIPETCRWLHWGDIDYGGFMMLLRLRKAIDPRVQPYRMDACELVRYQDHVAAIQPSYVEKLKKLSGYPELSDCRICMDYMIKNKVRLEQEIMLSDLETVQP